MSTENIKLAEDIASFEFDPLGFVYYAFPWGEEKTELEDEEGPREWQIEILEDIGRKLAAGGDQGEL